MMQNKVEEAEKKYKQIQEQLEGITQQVQELQPKCAELKAEAQRRNTLLKSSEVRFLCFVYNIFYAWHNFTSTEKITKNYIIIIAKLQLQFLMYFGWLM